MEALFPGIRRSYVTLRPDPTRVLLRPFAPDDPARVERILERVGALADDEVGALLGHTLADFAGRHRNLETFLLRRFQDVTEERLALRSLSAERKRLIGAYFTQEFALEGAALFNPSLVWHPDQSGLSPGERRFLLSVRATGEGHLSSIGFRTGVADARCRVTLDTPSRYVTGPSETIYPVYERALFARKLREMGHWDAQVEATLAGLGERFTLADLRAVLGPAPAPVLAGMLVLARANYEVAFSDETPLSERVLFPTSPREINGIEDARFVAFHEDDGSSTYYATYTAYDGRVAMSQLLETTDFRRFAVRTLNGTQIRNKGMALFPRRIQGKFALLSRQDNENLYLMLSDNIDFWYERAILLAPRYPWEFVQLGNCGAPLETEAGWLVLTHGVGPMRQYAIGATLLDRDDPSRVIGRLRYPLLTAEGGERDGYVPNVVYSCGAQIHNQTLILPYAVADSSCRLALVPLPPLLEALS